MVSGKENLHHAYLIEGDKNSGFSFVLDFLREMLGFYEKDSPVFWEAEYDTFGINEGREINELQSKKSSIGDKKIFIIRTNFITREAQNSLLKMFEEPTKDTHFFVIMNSSESLLSTLKSRLMIKKLPNQNTNKDGLVKDFLKANPKDRMEIIKQFFGDSQKKKPADRAGAIDFLNELEKQLRDRGLEKENLFIFDEIIKSRGYLNDRSPSVKMLLEHIATIVY